MIIKLKNFGSISEFEFDLNKDFHLIVGENNVGKSYAITAIYLVLKAILSSGGFLIRPGLMKFYQAGLFQDELDFHPLAERLANLKENNQIEFDKETRQSIIDSLSTSFLPILNDSLKNSFNSIENLSNQFVSEIFTIELILDKFSILLSQKDNELFISDLVLTQKIILRGIKQNRHPRTNEKIVTIYYNQTDKDKEESTRLYAEFIQTYHSELYSSVHNSVSDIHYLPASRSGLYQALSAFAQIIAELAKKRSFLTKKIELPNISEPLSDYFLKLSEIKVQKKSYENKPVNKIAEEIEKEILHGGVEFDPKVNKLFFKPDRTKLKLDLSATSSMVSELSPIVSFLRYIVTEPSKGLSFRPRTGRIYLRRMVADQKHLMIIEEPEAHLHPEIQIKLTEIFAKLVGIGVKIIITTHSNYIFNKVNNLILEKKLDIKALSATVFKNFQSGSKGMNLETDDLGIDDDNFIDAAEFLYEEKIKLIEELNKIDK